MLRFQLPLPAISLVFESVGATLPEVWQEVVDHMKIDCLHRSDFGLTSVFLLDCFRFGSQRPFLPIVALESFDLTELILGSPFCRASGVAGRTSECIRLDYSHS